MTRKINIILFLLLLGNGYFARAQNVTLNTRTGAASTNVLLATSTTASANYSRTASIYTAAEINAAGGHAGVINKLWWYKEGTGEYSFGNAMLKVYFKHVSIASHPGAVVWATDTIGSVPVFSSTTYSIPSGTGWKQLNFIDPFVWNGLDNIEIFVDWYRPVNPSATISWARSTHTGMNAATTSATASPGAPASLAANNNRPVLQLEIIDPLANDAALYSFVTPPSTFNAGLDSVSVKIRNWGGQPISSVNIDWMINGVLQTPVSRSFSPALAPTDSSVTIKLGNYIFASGYHTIKTWTRDPNNLIDNDRRNDTLSTTVWTKYPALVGTYTINPALPGGGNNFLSFSDAIRALNESGISGTVIFDVPANATFNESNILLTATGTATDSIVFRKTGTGNNPLITAQAGLSSTRDFIIGLEGSDYIVFDGINVQDVIPANTTTTLQMEWGFALFRQSVTNGSQHNVIRNCKIELFRSRTNGVGIYSANQAASASTAIHATTLDGTNSFNQFYNDSIINCNTGISVESSVITSGLYDENVHVGVKGRNVIMNFGGTSSDGGIYMTQQNNARIENNYVNMGSGVSTGTLEGICTLTGLNSNVDIHYNTVTVATTATSGTLIAIKNTMGAKGTSNAINISNNIITGCYASAAFTGIESGALAQQINVHHNIIENDSFGATSGNIYLIDLGSASGDFVGTLKAYNNTIRNIKRLSTSSSTMYGFYSGQLIATGETDIYGNHIHDISSAGGTGLVAGIHVYAPSSITTHRVYNNNIYNIWNDGTGRAAGINIAATSGSGLKAYAYNNIISGIKAPNSLNVNAAVGIIAEQASTIGLYYNTVYLNDTATALATSQGSAAIYANTIPGLDMRNNIFINASVPGSNNGIAAAYKRSSGVLASYSDSSDNNIFYTGVAGNRQYVYYDGTDSALTVGAFRSKMINRDQSSLGTLPTFVNTTTLPYDLHIDPLTATPVEAAGTPVLLPIAVLTDIDSNSRNAQTPDIGADEGSFISGDFEGPAISFIKLKNTSNTANRTLVVNISDASGVDSTTSGRPLLYFRKSFGSFISVPATSRAGNAFTFIIDYALLGGAFPSDVIEYYVAAQDVSPLVNVSTVPDGGFGINPPGYFPPFAAASYTILTPLNGTYYVGSSFHFPPASYPTLTAAFNDYNSKGLSGAVEFVLIDILYNTSTGEILPITINENPDASLTNVLTVKPEAGINAHITGTPDLRGSVLKLNGSDYVTVNGVNANNTSLTINNETPLPHPDSLNAVIWISSDGADNGAHNNIIKNCNIHGVSPRLTQVGIYIGTKIGTGFSQAVDANNNNNQIDSNYISKAQFGLIVAGNSTVNPAEGNKITNNRFGSAINGDGFYQQAIVLNRQNNGEVYRNEIQNIFSDEPLNSDDIYGINLLNSKNTIVHSNKIHNLKFTGNSYSYVAGISSTAFAYKTAVNASNNIIYNNVIFNLTSSSTNFTFNTSGINLSDGYGDKVYFNTISLTGQLSNGNGPSAAFSHGFSSVFGNSPTYGNNIDVRNNIFSVTGTTGSSGSKKLYAHYSKAPNASGNMLDNNILYVNVQAPAIGFVAGLNGADYATLAVWQTATAMEANSSAANPLLNTNTVLIPQTGSPALGSGIPLAGITTDFNAQTRSVTSPAIGAYEIGGDFRGPDISFTPLKNTTLTSNVNATSFANITDANGVNVITGTKPRLYYKKASDLNTYIGNTFSDNGWKWVEATNASSPFSFVIDYALLQGGTANITDTIQYFLVAQDNNSTINVGSSAALFNMASSVNLDATHFPVAEFSSYRIITGAQGYVYVGNGQPYLNLTDSAGLFAALKDQLILTGDLTVLITSDLSENGTNDLLNWQEEGTGGYRVFIRPDQAVTRTVSGNIADALIRINSTNRVVFDGIDTILNTGKYLRFVNQHTSNPVFSFINDARFDTIRNCIIEGANSSSSSGLIFIGGSANGGNNFNMIADNILSQSGASRYNNGVYAGGGSLSKNNSNNISGNMIRNFSGSGVYVSSNNGNQWNINNNHICDSFGSPATTAQIGIEFLAQSSNNIINNNYVGGQNWFAADSSWINSGNNAFIGIIASFDITGSNTVNGNVVKNITRTNTGTSASFAGIRLSRGNVSAINNMIGDSNDASKGIFTNGANVTSGIDVTSSLSNSTIAVQNNAISNMWSLGTTSANRLRGISYSNTSTSNNVPVNINANRIFNLYSFSNATGIITGEQAVTGIFANPNSSSTTYAPVVINKNVVYNINSTSVTDTATVAAGILVNNVSGYLNANNIYNIRNYSSRNIAANPAVSAGLIFRATNQFVVSNNMITAGFDTIDNISYIAIWNPFTGAGANLYHNSTHVRGVNYTDIPSYAFYRGNNNLTDLINTPVNGNNNIFFNERSGINSYAIGNNSSNSANGFGVQSWNNNVYYNFDPNKTGIWNGISGDFATFKTNSLKDSASVFHYLFYTNAATGDLHLSASSIGDVILAGIAIPSVATDFDNEVRNTTYPYIGADENTSVPVPVKLIAFNANIVKNDVFVSWITASEKNVSHFIVEASVNGKTFNEMGEVKAKGNSSALLNYTFTHNDAQRALNSTLAYYRLTTVDVDGSETLSDIVLVKFNESQRILDATIAYPNPFSENITIAIPSLESTNAEVMIIDLQGRVVASSMHKLVEGTNQLSIENLSALNKGIYFVKVIASGQTKVIKVVKN